MPHDSPNDRAPTKLYHINLYLLNPWIEPLLALTVTLTPTNDSHEQHQLNGDLTLAQQQELELEHQFQDCWTLKQLKSQEAIQQRKDELNIYFKTITTYNSSTLLNLY